MPLSTADHSYLAELGNLVQISEDPAAVRDNRTDTPSYSTFGSLTAYDLTNMAVPLLGSKSVSFANILHETIWMLKGDRSLKYMVDNNCNIWNQWLVPGTEKYDGNGKLIDGVVSALYPTAWRKWEKISCMTKSEYDVFIKEHDAYITKVIAHDESIYVHEEIDQVQQVIDLLKHNPMSRRIMLSAWDPGMTHRVKLPACHPFAQFYLENDGSVTCMFYMRSSDHFLGKPYNLVQYAVLAHVIAHLSGRKMGRLLSIVGDQHLYANHVTVAKQQLSGAINIDGKAPMGQSPRITINPNLTKLDDLTFDDIVLHDYIKGPIYKGDIAV